MVGGVSHDVPGALTQRATMRRVWYASRLIYPSYKWNDGISPNSPISWHARSAGNSVAQIQS